MSHPPGEQQKKVGIGEFLEEDGFYRKVTD